jgi:hypothetical protein
LSVFPTVRVDNSQGNNHTSQGEQGKTKASLSSTVGWGSGLVLGEGIDDMLCLNVRLIVSVRDIVVSTVATHLASFSFAMIFIPWKCAALQ